MKINQFIVVCILFSNFLLAQENYVSPIKEGNKLAGKFAPAWQSLQDYKTPEWFPNASLGYELIGSRSANPNRKIGLGDL